MTQSPVFELQILQTHISVQYQDIAQVKADAVVSSDDTFISATNGIPAYLCELAGKEALRRDIRKFTLPLPLGSVVVTGAGKLPYKYLLHALALDFQPNPNPECTIAQIVQNILNIANTLSIGSIAMPILLTQSPQNPEEDLETSLLHLPGHRALRCIMTSLICYIIMQPTGNTVKQIVITLADIDDKEASTIRQKVFHDLQPLIDEVSKWSEEIAPINALMDHLSPLQSLIATDEQLQPLIEERVNTAKQEIHRIIGEHAHAAIIPKERDTRDKFLSNEIYNDRRSRLTKVIQEMNETMAHDEELRIIHKTRLNVLEVQAAQQGMGTPPATTMEINKIREKIAEIELRLQNPQQQRDTAQAELNQLERRWMEQQKENASTSALNQGF